MKSFYTTLIALLFCIAGGNSLSGQNLVAGFSYQPLQPCVGQPVIFIDSSQGGPLGFWGTYDFGDGTIGYPGSATGGTPPNGNGATHTYTSPGTYTVTYCLYSQSPIGMDTSCTSKTLTVMPGPCTQTSDAITGRVYFDTNTNGTYEAGTDYPLKHKWVQIGNYQVMTDAQGLYQILLYTGTQVVSLVDPSPYTVSNPASGNYTFTLSGNGSTYTADFALTQSVIIQDLEVSIFSWRFRPGRPAYVWVRVKNNGTIPMAGTASLFYDSQLQYDSNTSGGSHDSGNKKVTFPFSGLHASQTQMFYTKLNVPASLPLGTPLLHLAQVDPVLGDSTPQNNYAISTDVVRGGYDPNDKAVSPGIGPEGYVAPDQMLRYRVRFQNTGTDTAFDIYILDTLDNNLDISSIEMVSSSHEYVLSIDDQRAMRWQFDNILLPDSGINEPLSHGYVEFLVKPIGGLADGVVINNFADIYFDFNAPVRTNTVLSTIWDKDSAVFDLPTPHVLGLEGTLDFETIYPNVEAYTENVGIGENAQDIQFYIQLDNYTRQLIGTSSRSLFAGEFEQLALTNFCIRNYYPGIPLTTAFRNSTHTLRFFAQEIGKTNSLDSATFAVTVSNPLPANLLSFAGYVEQSAIQLTWKTAFEENTEAFIIQKYDPATLTYATLDQIAAAGNANTTRSYQVTDEKPFAGINTYRLLQVDLNGNMHILGNGVEVNFSLDETALQVIQLYPNPFEGSTNMRLFCPVSAEMQLEVFDLMGKSLFNSQRKVQAGVSEIKIDLGEKEAGMYLYRLRFNGQEVSGRMMKL